MKRWVVILNILSALLLVNQDAFAALTKLSDSVYSYVGSKDASPTNSFAANAGIIIGKDSVLVVDTLISAKEGERLLADIKAVTDKPIRYVVNTHTHLDHALGNCVFAKLGALVISQEADRESLMKNGPELLTSANAYGLKPEDMAGTELAVPTLSFGDRLLIDLGTVQVQLIRTAPSHTSGSLLVFVPQEKLAFAGDILFTDFHPYLADGDFAGWQATLDSLLAMDVERIIPGHGPLSSKKDVQEMKDYLELFDAKAKELASSGKDADAITAALLEILPKRSLADWMVGYNVKKRYQTMKQ